MDIFIKSKLVPNTVFKQAVLPERPQALANACAVYNTFTLNSNPKNKMSVTFAASSYGTGWHFELLRISEKYLETCP